MKNERKLKWETPYIQILTHENIMGKENLPVEEVNKHGGTTSTEASTS